MKYKIIIALFLVFMPSSILLAQDELSLLEDESIYTENEVYINKENQIFAKEFKFIFNRHFLKKTEKKTRISSDDVLDSDQELQKLIVKLKSEYGLTSISRSFPDREIGRTVYKNKQGNDVELHDFSKVFTFTFSSPVSYLELLKITQSTKLIESIDYPLIAKATGNYPDDTYLDNQYGLKLINASKVWDITHGDPNIILGFSDNFYDVSSNGVHEDLDGRFITAQSDRKYVGPGIWGHGTVVALVAAASTNNSKGLASLGGNFKLAASLMGLSYFHSVCTSSSPVNCPDVINMSWVSSYSSTTKNLMEDLLDLGVVLVSASVNDIAWQLWPGQSTIGQPFKPFPAYINFPSKGTQVISTTATQLTDTDGSLDPSTGLDPFDYEERFRFENYGTSNAKFFNYGLQNDPITYPDDAFTDIAAPGAYYYGSNGSTTTHYGNVYGATSNAAPHVTATVGMMLSVNPNLTPSDVYDILIETANYDDIVVPPNAVTNNLGGGLKYNKYIGYGRLDAYAAVKESLPYQYDNYTFQGSTTLGSSHIRNAIMYSGATLTVPAGEVVVLEKNIDSNYNNVFIYVHGKLVINEGANIEKVNFVVEDGGEMIVQPGAEINLYTGAWHNIRINPGGKITAHGTEDDPIYFKRASSGTAWGQIGLLSSEGNSFEWVVFDGGNKTVEVRSNNNTFAHCTFKNGVRGISGYTNADGSGNGDATITYSLFKNNSTVGVVAEYADFDISYTNIQNNTQAGLYINSAEVYPFHRNIVTGNGTSSRDGIEVTSSGTIYLNSGGLGKGYNEIYDNADDQISGSGDLYLGIYLSSGGYNSIRGDYSGSKYLVDNNTGTTVEALFNHWDSDNVGYQYPVSAMFDGTVSTSSYRTSNPTSSVDHGNNGEVPAKAVSSGSNLIKLSKLFSEAQLGLEAAKNEQELRDTFFEMYYRSGVSRNEELKSQFFDYSYKAATQKAALFNTSVMNNAFRNTATVLYLKALLRDGYYDSAYKFIKSASVDGLSGFNKRDFLQLKMVVQAYQGEYANGLETLETYYKYRVSEGEYLEDVQAEMQIFEEDLMDMLNSTDEVQKSVSENIDTSEEIAFQAYPNPFNPTTNIQFTIPNSANVSLIVYDLLGREVANLVNGNREAGSYTVAFDGSKLASGIYIYKLQVGTDVYHKKMTLIK